jgi:hypothetical protein
VGDNDPIKGWVLCGRGKGDHIFFRPRASVTRLWDSICAEHCDVAGGVLDRDDDKFVLFVVLALVMQDFGQRATLDSIGVLD